MKKSYEEKLNKYIEDLYNEQKPRLWKDKSTEKEGDFWRALKMARIFKSASSDKEPSDKFLKNLERRLLRHFVSNSFQKQARYAGKERGRPLLPAFLHIKKFAPVMSALVVVLAIITFVIFTRGSDKSTLISKRPQQRFPSAGQEKIITDTSGAGSPNAGSASPQSQEIGVLQIFSKKDLDSLEQLIQENDRSLFVFDTEISELSFYDSSDFFLTIDKDLDMFL